jgi:hypothetical protein
MWSAFGQENKGRVVHVLVEAGWEGKWDDRVAEEVKSAKVESGMEVALDERGARFVAAVGRERGRAGERSDEEAEAALLEEWW